MRYILGTRAPSTYRISIHGTRLLQDHHRDSHIGFKVLLDGQRNVTKAAENRRLDIPMQNGTLWRGKTIQCHSSLKKKPIYLEILQEIRHKGVAIRDHLVAQATANITHDSDSGLTELGGSVNHFHAATCRT